MSAVTREGIRTLNRRSSGAPGSGIGSFDPTTEASPCADREIRSGLIVRGLFERYESAQSEDATEVTENAARKRGPGIKARIEEYLSKVVPGVRGVEARAVGPKETIEFRQEVVGSKHPWHFLAANASDGTLRALGILVALFQSGNGRAHRVPLVGIEEPEIALHPAAAGVLRDSLHDASQITQVLVTSHSPDLLDDREMPDDWILPVIAEQGITTIGPLDDAARSAIRDRLYTSGELLRIDQLRPEVWIGGQSRLLQEDLDPL